MSTVIEKQRGKEKNNHVLFLFKEKTLKISFANDVDQPVLFPFRVWSRMGEMAALP